MAFAGGVIVWTRFFAAEVPPDQAVNAVPRDELVSIGSSILLLFGFFGALAVLAMYLLDRGGRATPGMIRGLLVVLSAEGVVVIMLVDRPFWQRAFAALAFVLPVALAFAATFANAFVLLEDKLPSRDDENLKPRRERRRLQWVDGGPIEDGDGGPGKPWKRLAVLAIALIGLLALVLAYPTETTRIVAIFLGGLLLVAYVAHPVWKYLGKTKEDVERQIEKEKARGSAEAKELGERQEKRLEKRRPFRLVFRPFGMTLFAMLMVVAASFPSLLLEKVWLFAALGAAIVLFVGLWRIAVLSTVGFMWFGLAVFISVPLFGTLTAMAINLDDPQAQPMALIRKTDGPDEAIQGLYVTETDDRVYFATLSTEGCGDEIVTNSGRLLWVPRSEVVAMSIGPSEDVADARATALEMAYALTPAVETPAGDHVSLTTGERRAEAGGSAAVVRGERDQRLENVGAAVRPNFGIGLRLVPEDASPGEVVTLRMSRPNSGVGGFGEKREGRTLRLGGVPVPILRERVRVAEEGEFIKTKEGKILALDKEGVYVRSRDGFVLLDDDPDNPGDLFVRLNDNSGVKESSVPSDGTGVYLKLDGKDEARLGEGQTLEFADGEPVLVESRLLRQAWHENHIKFRVPDHASTGVISVECEQLAGQPLLRVANPPVARIAMKMMPGSSQVAFDSQRSTDGNGKIVSRHWALEGLRGSHEKRMTAAMPPRLDDYVVGLTVVDAEGQADTAWLHLLRLPEGLTHFEDGRSEHPDVMQDARSALRDVISNGSPAAVEFDAFPAQGAGGVDPGRALKAAEAIRDSLLTSKADPLVTPELMVRTLAYDGVCPGGEADGAGGRIDIISLSGGVQVVPPRECPPDRVRIARGWPPAG